MIARFQILDTRAALDDLAATLVAKDAGKGALGVFARQGEGIGMTDAARDHPEQHFPLARSFDVDFLDRQWLFRLPGNGGFGFHAGSLCFDVGGPASGRCPRLRQGALH
jgi:hypothetical protein